MTFGFSVSCDSCARTEHASDLPTADDAITQLQGVGWHIDPDTRYAPALCPQCLAKEEANADLGPTTPHFYPPPGSY